MIAHRTPLSPRTTCRVTFIRTLGLVIYTVHGLFTFLWRYGGGQEGGEGLGRAKLSQPLKLPPPPNTTDVAPPPHMSYHRKFLPVGVSVTHTCAGAGAAISRTLALLIVQALIS